MFIGRRRHQPTFPAGGTGIRDINSSPDPIIPSLGVELLTNNGFDTDTVWNKGTGWTISGGVGVGTSTTTLIRQSVFTIGNWYQLVADVVSVTSGTLYLYCGDSSTNLLNSPGTYTRSGLALNDIAGLTGSGAGFSGTVDNIYGKQISFSSMISLLGDIQRQNGDYTCHPTVALDSQCGIVIEYKDANNLVLALVDRSRSRARLYKRIGGTWTEVIYGAITYSAGAELKVQVNGNNHSLYYNGAQVGSTTAINDAGLGTKVYGFSSLSDNTVGLVRTSNTLPGGGLAAAHGTVWYVASA